jgi:hypothetical protein
MIGTADRAAYSILAALVAKVGAEFAKFPL